MLAVRASFRRGGQGKAVPELSGSEDLWARLARVDTTWNVAIQSVQIQTPEGGRRRWHITMVRRQDRGAEPILMEADEFLEALLMGVVAAESLERAAAIQGMGETKAEGEPKADLESRPDAGPKAELGAPTQP
jgi:hypothetical protein